MAGKFSTLASGGIFLAVIILLLIATPEILSNSSGNLWTAGPLLISPEVMDVKHNELESLDRILKKARMEDGTVILTTLNEAWAAKGGMMDFFLDRFRKGNGTQKFLRHLVIITVDRTSSQRCLEVHEHCFALSTEGADFSGKEKLFNTEVYQTFMWRRTYMLGVILKMGYNFLLTDMDIIWFRDPFQYFHSDADFEMNCDKFNGNEDDINNELPNGGFLRAVSNKRTIRFYDLWYESRLKFPGHQEQDVFIYIKHGPEFKQLSLRLKFLSTEFFSGLCEVSKNMETVSTIHANCCIGLDKKMEFLRLSAEDWDNYHSLSPEKRKPQAIWRGNCW